MQRGACVRQGADNALGDLAAAEVPPARLRGGGAQPFQAAQGTGGLLVFTLLMRLSSTFERPGLTFYPNRRCMDKANVELVKVACTQPGRLC